MSNKSNSARGNQGPRRNDLILCDNCGEYYSVTYKRCPFCDERPGQSGSAPAAGRGRRLANNKRGGGYGGPVNPVQIALLILSFILIVTAIFIVFKSLSPLFHQDPPIGSDSSISSSQGAASSGPQVQDSSISLNTHELALSAGERATLTFTLSGSTEGDLVWSSSDTAVASVDASTGEVTNTNTGSASAQAVITVTWGDSSDSCTVTCAPATPTSTTPAVTPTPSGTGTIAPNTECVITNASGGLRIRSGPGTTYEVLVSTENGASVTVLADAGDGWYKIQYTVAGGKKAEGYVMYDYVTPARS